MEEHDNLAKGYFKGDRVLADDLWKDLSVKLNSLGPPEKDVCGWKKVRIHWMKCDQVL